MMMSLIRSEPRRPARRRRTLLAVAAAASVAALSAAPASAAPPFISGWLAPTELNAPGSRGFAPKATLSDAGEATVVWEENRLSPPEDRIMASTRRPGGRWSDPVPLAPAGTNAFNVEVAGNRRGDTVAIWGGQTYGLLVSYKPAGGTWLPAKTITEKAQYGHQVVIDELGRATIAWFGDGESDPKRTVHVAQGIGGSWGRAPDPVQSSHGGSLPALALDRGYPTVAWRQQDGFKSRTLTADGDWAPEELISPNVDDGPGISLAFDRKGNGVVTWGLNRPDTVTRVATRSAGGSWEVDPTFPGPANGILLSKAAISAEGTIALAWTTSVGPQGSVSPETATFVTTKPSGLAWTTPQVISSGTPLSPVNLAFDGGEGLIATWSGLDPVPSDRGQTPFAARRLASGLWTPPTAIGPANSATSFYTEPYGYRYTMTGLAVDQAGNAIVAYAGDADRFAVRAVPFDAVGPTVDAFSIPATAKTDTPVAFSGSATDSWSTPSLSWSFGDGGAATGGAVSHTYTKPGTYTVQFAAVDGAGNPTVVQRTISITASPSVDAPMGKTPVVDPPVSTVPASLKGKALTLDALVKLKGGKKTCPKAKTLTVTVTAKATKKGGKKSTFKIAKTKLTVTKVGTACKVAGSVTLKTAPKKSQAVTVRLTSKTLKAITLKATRP